jgi:hypothetical protein
MYITDLPTKYQGQSAHLHRVRLPTVTFLTAYRNMGI